MPVFKKILKSQRGGKILIDQDGYLYNYLRETGKGSTWACRAKYKLNCYTRVYYCEGSTSDNVEITVDHNHPPKLGEARTIELMRKLKTGSKNSYKVRRELIKEINSQECIDLEQDLPTLLKNRKSKRRRRSRSVSTASACLLEDNPDTVILDVDSNAPDISTMVDVPRVEQGAEESSRENTECSGITSELEEVLQKLMNEPDLLQDLVNSLVGTEGESEGQVKAEHSPIKETDSLPQTSETPESESKLQLPLSIPPSSVAGEQPLIGSNPPLFPPETGLFQSPLISIAPKTDLSSSSLMTKTSMRSAPELVMTSSNPGPEIVMTSSNPAPELVMTSPGAGPQIVITSSAPQIVTAVPVNCNSANVVPSGQIVATVGQGSDNTVVAGQLVRLPESIISNDVLFTRMREGGCTLYIAPPALKNPYCRQCNTSFVSAEQMDHHFKSLKCCEMCKMAFCVQAHYDKHVELNHPDGNKSAWGTLCETCGRVFGVMFQLDSHRIKCSNRVSLRCPRCFYSFGFEGDLSRHKALHGSMLGVRCADCDKSFPTSLGLQNHHSRRRSANSREFVAPRTCTLCFKKFCLECDYVKHANLHSQEIFEASAKLNGASASQVEKVCHFCTKTFPTHRKLLAHQAEHLDVNICKFCGFWCQNKSELVEHERVNHVFKA